MASSVFPSTQADLSNVTGTLGVANGGTGVTVSTGSTTAVLGTSPTLVTPALGTPASGTLTNCTGLPEAGLTLAANTTNNVSTSKHGFAPVLPNDATKFLDGTGAYSAPASGAFTLLHEGHGSTTGTNAAINFDTYAVTGLTTKDKLQIFVRVGATGAAVANTLLLYNNSDGVTLQDVSGGNILVGNANVAYASYILDCRPNTANSVNTQGAFGITNQQTISSPTTAFTGSWTIALRATNHQNTSTADWAWEIYKVAGQ